MTLRGRLALVNMIVLLLALLLLAGIVLNQLVHDLYEQIDQELGLMSANALTSIKLADGRLVFAANSPQPSPQMGPQGFVRLLSASGQITDGIGAYNRTAVLPQTLQTPPQGLIFNQSSNKNVPLRVYTRPILLNNKIVGYLQVATTREEIEETLGTVRRSLLFGIPLALIISGLISLWTARQALRPLTKMTHSAAAITAEDLERRLPVPKANDEVQALAITFNATLDRLAEAFARQRRFTADASHELRTPVTAILGQAEYALNRDRTPQAYRAVLARIQSEAERMQRLIGRMLTLARVETGRQPLNLAPTDVVSLVHTLVDTLQPQVAAKGLRLNVDTPPALTITTDADSLTQILLNLLENAVTYTDQGHIDLAVTPAADHIQIFVHDTGPGISPDHLPYLFEPFYRVDASRRQSRGHVGLGLALTYELTQLLGGDIRVTSQPADGTTFTVTLPATPPK